VTLAHVPPQGLVDRLIPQGGGQVSVCGWAFARSVQTEPLAVHYYVDGRGVGQGVANVARPDVVAAYPGVGPTHGFETTLNVGVGEHSVCVFVINTGTIGNNTLLHCGGVTG
jgi:hypothetical protein